MNDPLGVIFTNNATGALNIVIKGLLNHKSHAVVTSMEHNSVLRPLASTGASYDILNADSKGYVNADDLEKLIKHNTSLIICTLSSNVCGSIEPFEKISKTAKKHNIPFLLDASQGAGAVDIDMTKMNIDFLAAPGHKGLMGPTGTGVLCINSDIYLKTLFEGGTGSESKLIMQPSFLPDRFESGTLNVVGIAGLYKGIEFVSKNRKEIFEKEHFLSERLAENLSVVKGVELKGYDPKRPRCGVISFTVDGVDTLSVSSMLNMDYKIAVRAGFHCSYTAHCTIGTEKTGTVRASFGPFNTMDDVDKISLAVEEIALQKIK